MKSEATVMTINKIINEKVLEEIEKEDCIFPLISPIDWKKKN